MNYYFFIAHYYDKRHGYLDKHPIKVEAESAKEAGEKTLAELNKFEAEYPYKEFQYIGLENIIPAAITAAEDDHSVSGLLEEV